jgi:hypothetical protein
MSKTSAGRRSIGSIFHLHFTGHKLRQRNVRPVQLLVDEQSSQRGYFPTVTMPLGPAPPVWTVGLAMSDSAPVVWSIVYWAMAERAKPVSPLVT